MRSKIVNGLRPCGTCGKLFPATAENFYQRKGRTLSSDCKVCVRDKSSRSQQSRYYAATREYHLGYITRNTKQRAKRFGIPYDIDLAHISSLLDRQNGLCAISKVPLTFEKGKGHVPTNASIDRIDSSGGYTKFNVQLVAWQVNVMKSNLGTTQLVEWCQKVIQGLNIATDSIQGLAPSGQHRSA